MPNPTARLVALAQARATHRVAQVGQVATHFWQYAASSNAPNILFLHGYRGTHEGVEAIVGALEDFNVFVPDLPGYGHSDPLPGAHTVDSYLDWLEQWVAELNLSGPVIVMGHSFGTVLAAGHGARNPGSAAARVLVNAVSEPAMMGTKRTLLRLTRLFYRFSNLLPEEMAMRVLNLRLFVRVMSEVTTKSSDKEFRRWIYEQHLTHFGTFANKRVVVEGFDASIDKTVVDYSAGITEPTLLIAGELDEVTSVAGQEKSIKTFSDGELRVIENVGHLTHYETPLLVAHHLRSFLVERGLV
jgi:pimeloyl-ACP methyl ester carboxylesterase